MPEGDTLFRTARTLQKALAGKIVLGFETTLAQISQVLPRYPVLGRTVLSAEAKGKWCLLHFSEDLTLLTHMKMSGSWHIYRKGERWQRPKSELRVMIEVTDFLAIAFDVPLVELHTKKTLSTRKGFSELGPDVLKLDFDEEKVIQSIQKAKHQEIGEVLLNQSVLAGIGNIYKSEICFVSRVHPFALVGTLSLEQIQALLKNAKKLMRANVLDTTSASHHSKPSFPASSDSKGSSHPIHVSPVESDSSNLFVVIPKDEFSLGKPISYFGERQTTGMLDPREKLWVYGREGKPCRVCGTIIQMKRQGFGARVTFFCQNCQIWPQF